MPHQALEFIAIFIPLYIYHAMGITIGYHRLLSHRSFSVTSRAVEYFWVLAGFTAFEGSPIWWSAIHRAHHRWVDTPLDPHSPRYGWFHSYFGWLTEKEYPKHIDPAVQCKDLLNDPIYNFLEQGGNLPRSHALNFAINLALRAVIWAVFGPIPALASLAAGLAVLQIPLMLNFTCHLTFLGYKNYQSIDDAVNVWWVGLLAAGEGWHANHHAAPGSARSGTRMWEFDLSWYTICLMKMLHLVDRINAPTHQELLVKSNQRIAKAQIDKASRELELEAAAREAINSVSKIKSQLLPETVKAR
jgi:stearoyl-CoA desaturase (delta-9 desaturase)